jgi:outer membrane protein assembly factor BamB
VVARLMVDLRRVLLGTACASAMLLAWAVPALATSSAVAYQDNAAHTGYNSNAVSTTTPTKLWSETLGGGAISYPLIVSGRVYVTVANGASYGTSLYALNAKTGKTYWGPVNLGGPYNSSGLAYDAGQVFTVNSSGVMEAFNPVTGHVNWATQLPNEDSFTSPPTALNGYVYTGGSGSGGIVYAVRESNGKLAWSGEVENGDDSSPAVSATGVWVSYGCGQTYDFNSTSGALIWHRDTFCEGGGGNTPVLAHGDLYVRDFSFPAVLKASNGKLRAGFSASGPPPAVDLTQSYDLQGSTLTATSLATGSGTWTFKGDGTLDSAPIVGGGTVLIGGSSGELFALSSATGTTEWSLNVGSPIPAPEGGGSTGLATSGGLIVVPAGSALVAYR